MHKLPSIACALSLLAGAGVASATTINVAILSAVGNTAYDNDMKSKIAAALPSYFTVNVLDVDATKPALTSLNGYQAVMVVGSQGFNDPAALGDLLQQYIDFGHGVVMAALSNTAGGNCPIGSRLCGTFSTLDYWAIEPGSLTMNSPATLGTVYVANSPILADVTKGFNGGAQSYRINGAVNANATRVADWSDGTPFIATRTFVNGATSATEIALNFFPVSSPTGAGGWDPNSDGAKIMANALYVAAGSPPDEGGGGDGEVPEPATYLATGTGLALLALFLKRQRRTLQCESDHRPRHR